jgi:hypothetical protein
MPLLFMLEKLQKKIIPRWISCAKSENRRKNGLNQFKQYQYGKYEKLEFDLIPSMVPW